MHFHSCHCPVPNPNDYATRNQLDWYDGPIFSQSWIELFVVGFKHGQTCCFHGKIVKMIGVEIIGCISHAQRRIVFQGDNFLNWFWADFSNFCYFDIFPTCQKFKKYITYSKSNIHSMGLRPSEQTWNETHQNLMGILVEIQVKNMHLDTLDKYPSRLGLLGKWKPGGDLLTKKICELGK